MKKKAVLGIPFAWLFAIIVGAFIIFLAIYFVSRIIGVQEKIIDTETAKKLSIIFDPMEPGLATGKSSIASFASQTRIHNYCLSTKDFGQQSFSISSKLSIGNKWSEESEKISVINKYVFSEKYEEGKTFYFFSKPFNFPYKVSELIFLSGQEYCFANAPDFVEEEVEGLNLKNIKIGNCTGKEKKVCFGSVDCDVNVVGNCRGYECNNEFDYGYVNRDEETVFYYKELLYAAIFSDPEIYECNIKRLMKRTEQLAYLYYDKAGFLVSRGCGAEISSDLLVFAQQLNGFTSSAGLVSLQNQAKILDIKNSAMGCELWN